MHAGYYDVYAEKIQTMSYGFLLHFNILFTYIVHINLINEETVVMQTIFKFFTCIPSQL